MIILVCLVTAAPVQLTRGGSVNNNIISFKNGGKIHYLDQPNKMVDFVMSIHHISRLICIVL